MQLVTLVAVIVSDQQNRHCNQKNWRVGSGVEGGRGGAEDDNSQE